MANSKGKDQEYTAAQKAELIAGSIIEAGQIVARGGGSANAWAQAANGLLAVAGTVAFGPIGGAVAGLIAATGVVGELIKLFEDDDPADANIGWKEQLMLNTAAIAAGLPLKFPGSTVGSPHTKYMAYSLPLDPDARRIFVLRMLNMGRAYWELYRLYRGTRGHGDYNTKYWTRTWKYMLARETKNGLISAGLVKPEDVKKVHSVSLRKWCEQRPYLASPEEQLEAALGVTGGTP